MQLAISPFLRKTLLLDAVVSGAAALLMLFGANLLAPLLGLPAALLFWAGLVLVPFVALLALTARRASAPRLLLLDVVIANGLWVIGSLALLATGLVAPTLLGVLFVLAQALAVALFAALQLAGLRQAAQAA
ncbi:hypothetical protein [Nitratireductor sp. ZSWI3]|uniref:hypothetical protein n=1 Tax=Nitratireductor sp. ZSWI3 TaxID=2966359 RepID=UPI002150524B|nr:hypothetical protein [Nitratireductor sp. ZSWI3]MCR4268392.1 hypothetical protein [Nitratireductor sp. ZSWI3]